MLSVFSGSEGGFLGTESLMDSWESFVLQVMTSFFMGNEIGHYCLGLGRDRLTTLGSSAVESARTVWRALW